MKNKTEKIEYSIRLAGILIDISANFPYSKLMCRDFIEESDEAGDIRVDITELDLIDEARRQEIDTKSEAFSSGMEHLETLAIYRIIAEAMLEYDTFLIHGSAMALDGDGYVFIAPSGTGKSTHTRLWREKFGDRVVMVNDDKPLIQIRDDQAYICGTPWDGKHHLSTNVQVPLKGICVLERAPQNSIRRVSAEDGFLYVYKQTYRPQDELLMSETFDLMGRLLELVPVYRMNMNNKTGDPVKVAYEGMRGAEG